MPPPPPAAWPAHPAFRISAALGAVGVVLLLVGAAINVHGLLFAGFGAGVGSLIAALAWRADLVNSWRRDHPRGKS